MNGTETTDEPCFMAARVDVFEVTPPTQFECLLACVPADVPTLWCASDESCCEGLACSVEGLCVAAPGTASGDASESTDVGLGTDVSSTVQDAASGTEG